MSDDTLNVLVPDEVGERELARVDGVRVVRYDEDAGVDGLPAEAAQDQVFVPGFLGADAARDLLDACPQVRLVQLLTAGAEKFVGALPDGVALSDCKGAHGGVTAEWVLAGLLAVLREIPTFVRDQDLAHWDQHITDTLTGKRVLLVGAGDLADQTARRLETFDVATITRVGRRARDGVHATSELPDLLPEFTRHPDLHAEMLARFAGVFADVDARLRDGMASGEIGPDARADDLLRLSIGIEAPEDLIADLDAALEQRP